LSAGIVALLSAAEILARQLGPDDFGSIQNVLFAFFNGEAFDYIGYLGPML
jgi:ABC-type enterochelin transport system permease subunit